MESAERQRFSALWCGPPIAVEGRRLGCKAPDFPSRAQPLPNRARQEADPPSTSVEPKPLDHIITPDDAPPKSNGHKPSETLRQALSPAND